MPGQIPPQLAALQSGQPIPGIAPTQPPPQIPKHGPGAAGAAAAVRPPPNQDVMPPLPMVLPPREFISKRKVENSRFFFANLYT